MGTKAKLSTKVISLFLSVLMAFGCASVALPGIALKVNAAAAAAEKWQALADAFSEAKSAGYLSSHDLAGVAEGAAITITDGTTAGYIYNIVKALGELLEDEGVGAHNSALRSYIATNLENYGPVLNTWQTNFLNTVLDSSGAYGEFTAPGDGTQWNGAASGTYGYANQLPAQTLTVEVTRSLKAAVMYSFDTLADVTDTVEYKYVITITAEAQTCESTNGSETGAYYQNTAVSGDPVTADMDDIDDAVPTVKTQIGYMRAYNNYVSSEAFLRLYNQYYVNGDFANPNEDCFYSFDTADITGLIESYYTSNLYANVMNCDGDLMEDFLGLSNINHHKTFVDHADAAMTLAQYKALIVWLTDAIPIEGKRNRDDYSLSDISSIEELITQATEFEDQLSHLTAHDLELLKSLYGYDPSNTTDTYANFNNYKQYISQYTYNYYLQEVKLAAETLLNNGASTEYVFTNEGSDFFTLINDMYRGSNYVKTSDTEVNRNKTYYVPTGEYAATADVELISGKTYYTSAGAAIENPTAENLSSYYEPTFTTVADPVRSELETYYEYAKYYHGLKGVGEGEYIHANYEGTDEECPISDTDLEKLKDFFDKAVVWMTRADAAGVNVSNFISDLLFAEINDIRSALQTELTDRGRTTAAFYAEYMPALDLMTGYNVEGKSINRLFDDITALEGYYSTLTSHYSWFADDKRGKDLKDLINKCYVELYDRVRAFYYDVQKDWVTGGNQVTLNNYYSLKGNIANINSINSTIEAKTGYTTAIAFLASKSSILSNYGRNTGAGTLYPDPGTTPLNLYFSNYDNGSSNSVVSKVAAYSASNLYNNLGEYDHDDIIRDPVTADMARDTTNVNDRFIAYFGSQPGGNGNKRSIAATVTKLDTFLANEHFTELLGVDEQGKGITTLTGYIQDLLAENIFTDKIVNTIIALLFPILTNLFEETVPELLLGFQGKPLTDFTDQVSGGDLYIFINGSHSLQHPDGTNWDPTYTGAAYLMSSTDTTYHVTSYANDTDSLRSIVNSVFGLKIYPDTFKSYLPSAYQSVKNAIGSATTWDAFANEDGDIELTFDWGIDSTTQGSYSSLLAAKKAKFISVLGTVFGSATKILQTLFGNNPLTLQVTGGSPQRLATAVIGGLKWNSIEPAIIEIWNIAATIKITSGANLYKAVWIPLMEALGMNAGTFSWSEAGTYANTKITGEFAISDLVYGLVEPLYQLILALSDKPITTLCKLLPNLAYHIMNNSLDNLLDITLTLNIVLADNSVPNAADGDGCSLNAEGSRVSGVIDLAQSLIISILRDYLKFNFDLNVKTLVGDMLTEEKLGFDITDLNSILRGVIGMIAKDENVTLELPAINTFKLATMRTAKSNSYSTNGARPNGVGRTFITADVEEVFYGVFEYLFRAVSQPGVLASILGLIETLSGSAPDLPAIIFTLLDGIESPDGAFAALIELLNEPKYSVYTYDWYQQSDNTYDFTSSPFAYLVYNTKWTDTKAEYLYENVDNIVNDIINMVDEDMLADYDGDANVWLDRTINSMFNNEGIMNVIELFTQIGGAMASMPGLVKMIRQQVKGNLASDPETNLFDWYNVWGYLYDDFTDIELEENQFIAYNVQNNQVYVYEAVAKKDTAGNDIAIVLGNETTHTWKIVQAYPATPTENIPWKINGQDMDTWNKNVFYTTSGDQKNYSDYTGLFSGVRWTSAGTSENGDPLYTWEVKLTSDIIGTMTHNGSTLKRVGAAPSYTGYYDEGTTYNVGDWYPLIDGDQIHDETSRNARAMFSAIFSELIGPLSSVFSFVLSGRDLYLFGDTESTALTIKGYPAYNNAIIPLLEALGVYDLKTQAQYDTYVGTYGTRAAFNYLVNKLFQAVDDLLRDDRERDGNGDLVLDDQGHTIGKGAFQKVIDVMPHLYYFLQSDGLSTVVKNIAMFAWQLIDTLRPIVNIDLDNIIHVLLCRLLKISYDDTATGHETAGFTAALCDMLGIEPAESATTAEDAAKAEKIFQFSVEHMTLDGIYLLVEGITGINLSPLRYALQGMIATAAPVQLNYSNNQTEPYRYTSYLVPNTSNTYKTYTLNFPGQDTITVTISALLDIITYEGNAAALDKLLGTVSELIPGEQNLLTGEGVEGLIQAIVKLMDDNPYSEEVNRPNWDYIFEGQNIPSINYYGSTTPWRNIDFDYQTVDAVYDDFSSYVGGFNFRLFHEDYMINLQYLTNWTPEIADTTVQMFEGLLDYVVSMIDVKSIFDDENATVAGFSDFIDQLLSKKVFTGETLAKVVDLLATVYNLIPENIRNTIDVLLDVEMNAWSENGYLWQNYPYVEDAEGNPVEDEDGNKILDTTKEMTRWEANPEYGWFVEGDPLYVDTRDEFFAAIRDLILPAANLFNVIFLSEDYKLFHSMSDDVTNGIDAQITINAADAYATALIPVLEALGLDLTGYEPDKYVTSSTVGGVTTYTYDGELFISDLVEILETLFDDVIYGPVNEETGVRSGGAAIWLLTNLPNIIYFINADGLIVSLENVLGAVNEVLNALNTVVDLPIDINDIMGSGLDLTAITMEGVFNMIYTLTSELDDHGRTVPGLYMRPELLEYVQKLYIGEIVPFRSANGYQSYKMVYGNGTEDEDMGDMLTVILSLALEFLSDYGTLHDPNDHGNLVEYNNAETLDRILFADSDMEGLVGDILGALRNPDSLNPLDVDWFYFNESIELPIDDTTHVVTVPGKYAFQYLNYSNQWTYDKAKSAEDAFEGLIFEALKMLVPTNYDADDKMADLYDRIRAAEGMGDLLNVQSVYSAESLQKVLDLVSGVFYGEDAILNEALAVIIGALLGADLTQWDGRYRFVSEAPVAGDGIEILANGNEINNAAATSLAYYDVKITPEGEGAEPITERQYVIEAGSKIDFVAGVTKVLQPAKSILAWLLFNGTYTFFNSNTDASETLITLQGSEGYKNGLALLLEAFGCTGLKYASVYEEDIDLFIKDLTNSIATRLEEIAENPVTEIVALIPELIYFINAGGLQATITGLLTGPLGLVNKMGAITSLLGGTTEEEEEPVIDESDYATVNQIVTTVIKKLLDDNDLNSEGFSFTLEGINLKWIFEAAEVITGMEITDVIGNKLDMFYMGELYGYASRNGGLAYKMRFLPSGTATNKDSFADFVTILLSAVIDILEYQEGSAYVNVDALVALLKMDDDTAGMIRSVVALLQSDLDTNPLPIDWLYFDDYYSKYTDAGELKPAEELHPIEPNTLTIPESPVMYLTYASDWTPETSQYILDNIEDIVNGVVGMIPGMEGQTVAEILAGTFSLENDLYTAETISSITGLISGLELPSVVETLLRVVLDIDLSSYEDLETITDEDLEGLTLAQKRAMFVAALTNVLSPLSSIIAWILFGQDLAYFDKITYDEEGHVVTDGTGTVIIEDLIKLSGANAYDNAIVPLLEAIGVDAPAYTDQPIDAFLYALINNTLVRVEEILADPVNEIMDLLPNLIYFINTNALATLVNNLLDPIVALLNKAKGIIFTDLTEEEMARDLTMSEVLDKLLALFANAEEEPDEPGAEPGEEPESAIDTQAILNYVLDNIDFTKLDLVAILTLVEGMLQEGLFGEPVTLKIVDVVGADKIDKFYLNDITPFESANGEIAFRMPGSADMITVFINFVMEILLYKDGAFSNAASIDILAGTNGLVEKIVNLILGLGEIEEPEVEELNWHYYGGATEIGDGILVPNSQFVYLDYSNQWTFEKAVYMDEGLEDLVTEILTIAGVPDGDISALIGDMIDLNDYLNADTLNSIVDMINGIFNSGDITLPDAILDVIGLILNMDLSKWDGKYDFVAEAAEGAAVETSAAYSLSYYEADGKTHYIISDTDDFASGLQLILEPAQGLLGWLLLGNTFGFFVSSEDGNVALNPETGEYERQDDELIRVPGTNGYDTGLVLLLEALGCENLKPYTEYTDISVLVKDVIVSVLDRVEVILNNPIEELLALIPEIIYFINAGGLGAVVQNFASVLIAIVNEVLETGLLDDLAEGDLAQFLTETADGYEVDLDGIMENLIKDLLGDKCPADFTFSFDEVNLQFVIDLVEIFTGLEIDEVVGYTFERFVIGVVVPYDTASVAFEGDTYKLQFRSAVDPETGEIDHTMVGQTRADMITILLSLALDLLDKPENVTALVELINSSIEDPEEQIDEDVINAIIALLKGGNLDDMMPIDWFYFDPDYSLYDENSVLKTGDAVPTVDYTTTIDTPVRSINYIKYYTDWTEEMAEYLDGNLDAILAEVFDLIGMEGQTVSGLIEGVFTLDQIYNRDIFVTVIDTIQGLINDYGETLVNTLGLILGADFSTLATIDTDTLDVSTKEDFAATLVTVLEPAYVLLNWLLFGEDMKYFYDNELYRAGGGEATAALYDDARDLINLSGAEGYKHGLVPLLEALGVDLPEYPAEGKLVAGGEVTESFLYQVIIAVLGRVEEILANPVNEILELLPNVLYFINAGGLSASVFNTINAVYGLLPQIRTLLDTLGVDLVINGNDFSSLDVNVIVNSLLADVLPDGYTLDVTHIDLMAIVNLIEAITGMEISDVVTQHNIRYFYFGKLEIYNSGSGKKAFRMVYSEDENRADMITLAVNFIVEVLLYGDNADALIALINSKIDDPDKQIDPDDVNTVISLLTGETNIFDYEYGQMKWNYFNGTVNVATVDTEGHPVPGSITVPTSQFIYLEYENDWTLPRADGIDKNLASLVDGVIALIQPDGAYSLSDLLNGYYEEFANDTIFTADNLNAILDFVQSFIYGDDSVIGEHLATLAGLLLGGDITGWNRTYSFADYDESATYLTDSAANLRYLAVDGIKQYAIENEDDFINALYLMLKPASHLLGWLLLGDGYNFFAVDQDATESLTLINIPGTEGYGNAIALLLEALGVDDLKPAADYFDAHGNADGAALLKDILTGVVARIDEIIADPVNEVLDLIPELIYFINANGLSVVVNNLVGPLLNAVNAVVANFDLSQLDNDIVQAMLTDEGTFDPIGYVERYVTSLINSYTYDPITFTLDGVNTGWAVKLIEALTDVQIMEVLGTDYPISTFVLGTPTAYETVSNFDEAYKIKFTEADKYNYRCDLITIVLSLAIELLENGHNQAVIEDEFGLTAGTIADVLVLLKERSIQITPDYDWFYFDDGMTFDNGSFITTTVPERSINYLTYASNWDEDFADYLDDHLNSVIASVLDLAGMGDTTVAEIIAGIFTMDSIYTVENLEAIRDAIKDLVAQLDTLITDAVGEGADSAVIADAINLILDIDLHAWDNMEFDPVAVTYKEGFAAALADILAPLKDVIKWLFFGGTVRLFNRRDTETGTVEDILVINGYDGYNEGLVPLLEALGVDLTEAADIDIDVSFESKIKAIVLAALNRAEEILADPVDQVLALLPEIFYFINANGLAASVNHMLGAPLSLVESINALLADLGLELNIYGYSNIDLDGILNSVLNDLLADKLNGKTLVIDTKKLDLVEIVKIVELFTDLELVNVVTETKLDNFYLGQIYSYPSANGKTLFKMGYSEEEQKDRADMITVLINFIAEAALYEDNDAVIENLAGLEEGTIDMIIEALHTLSGEDYAYDWNYFWGIEPEETEGTLGYEAAFDRYATPEVQFNNYLTYRSDWTKSLANDLYENLDTIINSVLAMTGNEASTLGEIINNSFTLYKGEYLNKILELVQQLYDVLDDTLIGVIDEFLDIDLTYWRGLSFDEARTYSSTDFAAAVVEIVKPIYSVVDWLFFGKDITLFVDNAAGGPENGGYNLIVIDSVDAYATGLAPVLEALGVELPAYDGTQKCDTQVTVNGVTMDYFAAIINAALSRVDAILADPIPEVLEMLPEALYFINANGLSTAVYNMLGGVIDVVNTLNEKGIISLDAENIQAYVLDQFNVDINKLDLVGIFNIVENIEALHGLKLNEVFTGDFNEDGVEENILEYFYIGDYANAYISNVGNFKGYKLSLDEENKGDLLTMLLSVVLEVLLYDENEAPITEIIRSFKEDFTQDNYHMIKLLLTTGLQTDPEMLNINWVYFLNLTGDELNAKIEEVLSAELNNLPSEPLERTKNALKYGGNEGVENLWNTGIREYLNQNLESIVDLAIAMATKNSDTPSNSLSDLLQNNLDLWSDDTANALLGYIKNALSRVDDVLVDTVGSLLGAGQLSTLKNTTAVGIESKEDFVDFFVDTLSPLSTVLDFVLFGGEYKFFTHLDDGEPYTIILKGGEGYKYGVAPILAALGVDTDISEESTEVALREVLTKLTDRIDDILYGGDTINEALKLILNVIYFINADGLSTSVMNLLAPIDELLNEVNDVIGFREEEDLKVNDFITQVDLTALDFDFIFDLVMDKTGINVADPIGSYIKEFYFGATEYFTSYGDLGNFRMVYTEEENRIDMITILVTLVLDVVIYEGNHDALVGLVKNMMNADDDTAEQYVDTIVALLLNQDYRVPMLPYKWAFVEYGDTGTVISAANGLTGDSIFGTGIYGPLYTREMGAYISRFLPLFIDTYLVLLGVKNENGDIYRNLEDLLKQLIGDSIYTNDILQKIGSAITGAVASIKESIGEEMFNHVVNVLNASLGVDLNDILYGRIATIEEGNEEQFIQAICDLLAPAAPILKWLLSDYDIALFNHDTVVNPTDTYNAGDDYIVLKGAEGYQNAVVPILEALRAGDSTGIKTQAEYNELDGADMIKYILTPIFSRLDDILDDPINGILNELPAVVYFLNSNGLDTAFKNLLNAVYSLLNAIEPITGEIDLYDLIGIHLDEVNVNTLLQTVIESLNVDQQFKLSDIIADAVVELSIGTVDSFTSVRLQPEYLKGTYENGQANYDSNGNAIDYTMHYSANGAGGDQVDYVTILMRLLLKFISIPQNVTAVEAMLKGKLNDTGYKFLCSLLENFSQMAATEDGMDKIMYTVYYIFYAALNAGVATNNGLAEFNGNYSFLNQLFATSNVGFLRQLEISLGDLLNKYTPEIIDDDEVIPQGQISFWQKIINFFKKIADFFKNLFK